MNLKVRMLKEGVGYNGSDEAFKKNYELSKFVKQYANEVITEGSENTFNKYYLVMSPIGRKLLRNLKENDQYVRMLATADSPLLFEGYLQEADVQMPPNQVVQKAIDKGTFHNPFNPDPKLSSSFDFTKMKTPQQIEQEFDKNMTDIGNQRVDQLQKMFNMGVIPPRFQSENSVPFTPEAVTTSQALMQLAQKDPQLTAALGKENPELAKAIAKADHTKALNPDQGGFMGWLAGLWNGFSDFFKHLFTDPVGTITKGATSFGAWVQANPLTAGALAAVPVGLLILSKIRKGKKK
jgi:hypothetical protein